MTPRVINWQSLLSISRKKTTVNCSFQLNLFQIICIFYFVAILLSSTPTSLQLLGLSYFGCYLLDEHCSSEFWPKFRPTTQITHSFDHKISGYIGVCSLIRGACSSGEKRRKISLRTILFILGNQTLRILKLGVKSQKVYRNSVYNPIF